MPCPSGQEADPDNPDRCRVRSCDRGKHRHGTGECKDDHPHTSVGPGCDPAVTADTTVRWVYHDSSGNDTDGSKICGPPESPNRDDGRTCQTFVDGECTNWVTTPPPANLSHCAATARTYPYRKTWGYPHALSQSGDPARRSRVGHAGYRENYYVYSSSTPLRSGPDNRLWRPQTVPASGVVDAIIGEPFQVAHWAGGAWDGADMPDGWRLSSSWQTNTEGRSVYGPDGRIVKATSGCARVYIAHAGTGWRLLNLVLEDDDPDDGQTPATSRAGYGRRSFTPASKTDPDETAWYVAEESWNVSVSLDRSVGAPYPACHPNAWFSPSSTAENRLGVTASWTISSTTWADDDLPTRSCGWTVTFRARIPLAVYSPPSPASEPRLLITTVLGLAFTAGRGVLPSPGMARRLTAAQRLEAAAPESAVLDAVLDAARLGGWLVAHHPDSRRLRPPAGMAA